MRISHLMEASLTSPDSFWIALSLFLLRHLLGASTFSRILKPYNRIIKPHRPTCGKPPTCWYTNLPGHLANAITWTLWALSTHYQGPLRPKMAGSLARMNRTMCALWMVERGAHHIKLDVVLPWTFPPQHFNQLGATINHLHVYKIPSLTNDSLEFWFMCTQNSKKYILWSLQLEPSAMFGGSNDPDAACRS